VNQFTSRPIEVNHRSRWSCEGTNGDLGAPSEVQGHSPPWWYVRGESPTSWRHALWKYTVWYFVTALRCMHDYTNQFSMKWKKSQFGRRKVVGQATILCPPHWHGRRHVGGRVGNRPPWKKSGWAMPTLEIPTVVWKPSGNSLSIKV